VTERPPPADRREALREKFRERLRNPRPVHGLSAGLWALVGIPLAFVAMAWYQGGGFLASPLAFVVGAAGLLVAAWAGRRMLAAKEQQQLLDEHEARYDVPGLARLLNGGEAILYIGGSFAVAPAIAAALAGDREVGFAFSLYLLAGWFAGLAGAVVAVWTTRMYLQDNYGSRLIIDALAAWLIVGIVTADTTPTAPPAAQPASTYVPSPSLVPRETTAPLLQAILAESGTDKLARVRRLLDDGVSVQQTDATRVEPIVAAVREAVAGGAEELAVVRLLLERGANKNARIGSKPLIFEAARKPEVLEALLEAEADPQLVDFCDSIWTAVDDAPAERLIALSERIPAIMNPQGPGPLHVAVRRELPEALALIRHFVGRGYVVGSYRACPGWGVVAAMVGPGHARERIEAIELLRRAGAELVDHSGQESLAVRAAVNPDLLRYLIRQGVAVDLIEADGKTTLDLVEERGHPEAARILRAAGATRRAGPRHGAGLRSWQQRHDVDELLRGHVGLLQHQCTLFAAQCGELVSESRADSPRGQGTRKRFRRGMVEVAAVYPDDRQPYAEPWIEELVLRGPAYSGGDLPGVGASRQDIERRFGPPDETPPGDCAVYRPYERVDFGYDTATLCFAEERVARIRWLRSMPRAN
jgi:hypothetical protein